MRHDGGELIDEIVSELRRPVVTDPAAKARIMIAVRGARRSGGVIHVWQWLREPRTLRISPLAGLAAAAGIAAVLLLRGTPAPTPRADAAAPASRGGQTQAATRPRVVQFVLVAPTASHVALVGDFNDWDAAATPLHQMSSAQGVWSVTLQLTPGRHLYAFVVDDSKWVPDPSAARAPEDDFGAPNSVIMVGDHAS
jgi:hypothetical protein